MDTQDLSKVTVSNLIHVIDLKYFPCVRLVVVHPAPTGKKKNLILPTTNKTQQQTKHVSNTVWGNFNEPLSSDLNFPSFSFPPFLSSSLCQSPCCYLSCFPAVLSFISRTVHNKVVMLKWVMMINCFTFQYV